MGLILHRWTNETGQKPAPTDPGIVVIQLRFFDHKAKAAKAAILRAQAAGVYHVGTIAYTSGPTSITMYNVGFYGPKDAVKHLQEDFAAIGGSIDKR